MRQGEAMTAAIIEGAAPAVNSEIERVWTGIAHLGRRLSALENERARNITALVEDGAQLSRRLDALETRLPKPLPVVSPLSPEYVRSLAPSPDYRIREPAPDCTGISAVWCPVHGDCSCPRLETGERSMESDSCPLHAAASQHSEPTDDAATDDGPCGCDEAVGLRARVAELESVLATESRVRLRVMNEADGLRERIKALEREIVLLQRAHGTRCDEATQLRGVIARLGVYADTYGKDLMPNGPDTYGEGVRAAKRTVKELLAKVRP